MIEESIIEPDMNDYTTIGLYDNTPYNDVISNKADALQAIQADSYQLQRCSERLKNDIDVVVQAVKKNGDAICWANLRFRTDKKLALKMILTNHLVFVHMPYEVINDKRLVMVAVKESGFLLGDASERLRNNREVVLEAVRKNGLALEFASDRLQADKEIVLQAVKDHPTAITYASEELQQMCEGHDPMKALQSAILNDKLEDSLKMQPGRLVKNKI